MACLYLALLNPTKKKEFTLSEPSDTGLWSVALWLTLPQYQLTLDMIVLFSCWGKKTRTHYLNLDLWVVQRHTGAWMELHNAALWRQRRASLAVPHPGYLISERWLTGESPQDQRRGCQTTCCSLTLWQNGAGNLLTCKFGDAERNRRRSGQRLILLVCCFDMVGFFLIFTVAWKDNNTFKLKAALAKTRMSRWHTIWYSSWDKWVSQRTKSSRHQDKWIKLNCRVRNVTVMAKML